MSLFHKASTRDRISSSCRTSCMISNTSTVKALNNIRFEPKSTSSPVKRPRLNSATSSFHNHDDIEDVIRAEGSHGHGHVSHGSTLSTSITSPVGCCNLHDLSIVSLLDDDDQDNNLVSCELNQSRNCHYARACVFLPSFCLFFAKQMSTLARTYDFEVDQPICTHIIYGPAWPWPRLGHPESKFWL